MSGNTAQHTSEVAKEFQSFLEDEPLLEFFKKAVQTSKKIAVLSFPIKSIDPLACLEILSKENAFQFYWEKPNTDFAVAGGEALQTLSSQGNDRFTALKNDYDDLVSSTAEYSAISHSFSGLHVFGGGAFFDNVDQHIWEGFQPASFTLPKWSIIRDGKLGIATVSFSIEAESTANSLFMDLKNRLSTLSNIFDIETKALLNTCSFSKNFENIASPALRAKWITMVDKAKDLIYQNHFQKIVLARCLKINIDQTLSATALLHKLRQKYADCFNFLIKFPGSQTFIGTSPERLVSFHQSYINTAALAGSISRGGSASEDLALENKLRSSQKDLQEHQFVTKALKKRLRSFSEAIEQSKIPAIKKLSNVQHLYTPIRARLRPNSDRLSILETLHPTPAVGGYPWHKAKPYLKNLEKMERGWYAGPIGWINARGGGEFAVAIRSGLIGTDHARFYAGCGIVKDSDAHSEWEETNLKLLPMLSALNND